MLTIFATSKFRRDLKKLLKDPSKDIEELNKVIDLLANEQPLPTIYKDHALKGRFNIYRECHIASDWLLIYRIDKNNLLLTLVRSGSHSNLLQM